MHNIIIEAQNLGKQYPIYRKAPGLWGTVKALFHRTYEIVNAARDITFTVREGELVGFLGPNGAGKTTTMKMLSGIIEPTTGTARVLGFTPYERRPAYQHQFSLIMGQRNQLLLALPAMDSFRMIQAIYEIPQPLFHARLDELVLALDAKDFLDIQVRKLSLGQRMKCELIAALLHQPKVLFLDEPTIGLDVIAQKNIREFIKKYNRENKTTILLTSHYMEDIEELCDRVIIISKGSIIYDGRLDDLIRRHAPHKLLRISFTGEGAGREVLSSFGRVTEYQPHACIIEVPRDEATKIAAKILGAGLPIDDLLIDEVAVDDIIRTIFSGTATTAQQS